MIGFIIPRDQVSGGEFKSVSGLKGLFWISVELKDLNVMFAEIQALRVRLWIFREYHIQGWKYRWMKKVYCVVCYFILLVVLILLATAYA